MSRAISHHSSPFCTVSSPPCSCTILARFSGTTCKPPTFAHVHNPRQTRLAWSNPHRSALLVTIPADATVPLRRSTWDRPKPTTTRDAHSLPQVLLKYSLSGRNTPVAGKSFVGTLFLVTHWSRAGTSSYLQRLHSSDRLLGRDGGRDQRLYQRHVQLSH
eukprot:184872-Rhodomonas_salina.1